MALNGSLQDWQVGNVLSGIITVVKSAAGMSVKVDAGAEDALLRGEYEDVGLYELFVVGAYDCVGV